MFKELIVIILVACVLGIINWLLYKKKKSFFQKELYGILFAIIIINIIYDLYLVIPKCYYDTVEGHILYGTSYHNLIAYRQGFIFEDQIIFPIIRNRKVWLDSTASVYETFFTWYADGMDWLELGEQSKEKVIQYMERETEERNFRCLKIMNYIKLPDKELQKLLEENVPSLYIDLSGLKDEDELVAIMSNSYNVYILSVGQYEQIIGE